MTGPAPFPRQADALKLSASAKPVSRINRRVLFLGSALCLFAVLAALSVSAGQTRAGVETVSAELYTLSARRPPEGLSALPVSYEGWQPGPGFPLLGTPQSGDLGGTIVAEEDRWGLTREWEVMPEDDFRPSPEDEALRARRLADAKLADQAVRAGVFFDLSGPRRSALSDAPPSAPLTGETSAFLALAGRVAGADTARADGVAAAGPGAGFVPAVPGADIYNPYALQTPVSPYQLMAGSLISASLITGLNSDLPGTVVAQITQPVYDTVSGAHLLIPQGARLIGRYQSGLGFGQNRAMVVWDRILMPDGSSLRIAEPGTDASGAAGLSDRTDSHWDRVFAAAGLATLLGIGTELGEDTGSDISRAIRRGAAGTLNQAGQRVVDRNLGIPPTVRVRPGWPVKVLVTRDLVLTPYAGVPAP